MTAFEIVGAVALLIVCAPALVLALLTISGLWIPWSLRDDTNNPGDRQP